MKYYFEKFKPVKEFKHPDDSLTIINKDIIFGDIIDDLEKLNIKKFMLKNHKNDLESLNIEKKYDFYFSILKHKSKPIKCFNTVGILYIKHKDFDSEVIYVPFLSENIGLYQNSHLAYYAPLKEFTASIYLNGFRYSLHSDVEEYYKNLCVEIDKFVEYIDKIEKTYGA